MADEAEAPAKPGYRLSGIAVYAIQLQALSASVLIISEEMLVDYLPYCQYARRQHIALADTRVSHVPLQVLASLEPRTWQEGRQIRKGHLVMLHQGTRTHHKVP